MGLCIQGHPLLLLSFVLTFDKKNTNSFSIQYNIIYIIFIYNIQYNIYILYFCFFVSVFFLIKSEHK